MQLSAASQDCQAALRAALAAGRQRDCKGSTVLPTAAARAAEQRCLFCVTAAAGLGQCRGCPFSQRLDLGRFGQ